MTWTYLGFPEDNTKDEVRFLINDTRSTDQLLQDEEIYYLLRYWPNPLRAAAMACDTLASRYTRNAIDKKVGDLALDFRTRGKMYMDLAGKFWTLSKEFRGSPQVFAGGISISQKRTEEQNSDRVVPEFYRRMNDFYGTIIGTSQAASFQNAVP